MNAITLRKLPPKVAEAVRKRAAERRTSLNRAVIGLLEESPTVAPSAEPAEHHDLDVLCGAWSRAEFLMFERALEEQRRLDPDVWK
jgi:hypothetical protein